MSQMIDFTLPSCQPGRTLHAFRCVPEGEVRAVLQLSHGMVEFIDRYKPLAENLAARGILVTGNDHLGHGDTAQAGEHGHYGEPNGRCHLLNDLHTMNRILHERFPDTPIILYGHSMGSFLTRTYIIDHPEGLKGVVISGTGQNPAAVVAAGKLMAKLEMIDNGPMYHSPTLDKLAFGSYNLSLIHI